MIRIRYAWPCLIWAALLQATPAAGQMAPPQTQPVPPELLSGDSLVVDELNFRLDGPGKPWTWRTMADPTGKGLRYFLCMKGQTGLVFVVTVQPGHVWGRDPKFLQGFREGAEEEAAKSGAKIRDIQLADSDLPLPESSRVTFTMKHPIGLDLDSLTYIHSAGTSYYLQSVWIKGGPQPAEFEPFVRSFRLLRPAPPPDPTRWAFYVGLAVGAALVAAVYQSRLNARRARRAPEPPAFDAGSPFSPRP